MGTGSLYEFSKSVGRPIVWLHLSETKSPRSASGFYTKQWVLVIPMNSTGMLFRSPIAWLHPRETTSLSDASVFFFCYNLMGTTLWESLRIPPEWWSAYWLRDYIYLRQHLRVMHPSFPLAYIFNISTCWKRGQAFGNTSRMKRVPFLLLPLDIGIYR